MKTMQLTELLGTIEIEGPELLMSMFEEHLCICGKGDISRRVAKLVIAFTMFLISLAAVANPSIGPKPVGFSLGLAGAIVAHEAGHALVASLCGWEVEAFGFYSGSLGIGGGAKLKPDGTANHVKGEYLAVFAAGSLMQAIPVLAAPAIAGTSPSLYVRTIFDYLSTFGSLDFTFYSGKDLLMMAAGLPEAKSGDWAQFSSLSGLPLPAIFVASLFWSYALLQYQTHAFKIIESHRDSQTMPAITVLNARVLAF
jgi:hypothetical protein